MSENPASSTELKCIIEAILLAAGEPLTVARIASVFEEKEAPAHGEIAQALEALSNDLEHRGIELVEVASGFRLQTRPELAPWVQRLWEERPQRYSRALLETLALIAYRQPITRGEIEEVRGVSVSSSIIRTLQEREWIRVVGHRDVPGKPALFGTTKAFLDYFKLKSLDDLPTLAEIRDMENLEPELALEGAMEGADPESAEATPTENTDEVTDDADETDTGNENGGEDDAAEDGGHAAAPTEDTDTSGAPENETMADAGDGDAAAEPPGDTDDDGSTEKSGELGDDTPQTDDQAPGDRTPTEA